MLSLLAPEGRGRSKVRTSPPCSVWMMTVILRGRTSILHSDQGCNKQSMNMASTCVLCCAGRHDGGEGLFCRTGQDDLWLGGPFLGEEKPRQESKSCTVFGRDLEISSQAENLGTFHLEVLVNIQFPCKQVR